MNTRNKIIGVAVFFGIIIACIVLKTLNDIRYVPESLLAAISDVQKPQVFDRYGNHLTVTYENKWNILDYVPLHEIPDFLLMAFIISEDKRFYHHHGVDWLARINALKQNIIAMDTIRGASTITEQVVKMIHPRPRTIWSRWLEGFEAKSLERKFTKSDILEFYLNQVPYASNRRGIAQAARFYFDRDIETLSKKEMIALAAMVRAPSYLDLRKNPSTLETAVKLLLDRLILHGVVPKEDYKWIMNEKFHLEIPKEPIYARHFVHFLFNQISGKSIFLNRKIMTTLDGNIQSKVQEILDQSLKSLSNLNVHNGAVLVVENTSNNILAWSVAGHGDNKIPGSAINAVLTPRQPGSSLKPFLYALALEKGWTAATIIEDAPLADSVGKGLHEYHNFSRLYYGPVTLRQALGNSLNIPAIQTIKYVGVGSYLETLYGLGVKSLSSHPDFYGHGLALGNGEISLFELVQAYTVFANHGKFLPLSFIKNQRLERKETRIFTKEIASIIGNILSDAEARSLEFGYGGILSFPVQTAVKTGTSSDYRDAWALGFDYHYTVGVWMGNLDGSETNGLTGSKGPAIVLRSLFSELNKNKVTRPLYLSPKLIRCDICLNINDDKKCFKKSEWFVPGTVPETILPVKKKSKVHLVQPKNNLHLAMDPRIPDDDEMFEFIIDGIDSDAVVEWELNKSERFQTKGGKYSWPLHKGIHTLTAVVWEEKQKIYESREIRFIVK